MKKHSLICKLQALRKISAGSAKVGGGTMRRAMCGIAIVVAFMVAGCSSPPRHSDAWLSWKYVPGVGCGDYFSCAGLAGGGFNDGEALVYYCTIGIDPADCAKPTPPILTLDQWKAQNGFATSGIPYAEAVYANLGDLRIGRDMNCWRYGPNNQNVACFVTNYGPAPYGCATDDKGAVSCGDFLGWPNIDSALQDAVAANNPFATVAMVYNPGGIGVNGDKIAFYAFGPPDSNGVQSLIPSAALDDEGPKTVPRMCMACHGGTYDSTAHKVTGTSFLPFDTFYFRYSKVTGFTYDDQQDAFRALNEMVIATNPPQATAEYINGTYPNGIHTAGSPAVDGFVPANWSGNPDLYNGVVRQYCRMCHFGQPEPFVNNYSGFQNSADLIQALVCSSHDMPHAEVPYGGRYSVGGPLYKVGFWWDGAAQRDLGNFLNAQGVTNTCLPHD